MSLPVFVPFFILTILTTVRWNLKVNLSCISLMAKDAVEHFKNTYWPSLFYLQIVSNGLYFSPGSLEEQN